MTSLSRALSFVAIAGLVASAAWTWSGCSSSDDAAGGSSEAAADEAAPRDARAPVDGDAPTDAADAAPFVQAPHAPWPALLPHTGRLLEPMTLVTVVAANDDLIPSLFAFGDALVASAWWTTTSSEYGVGRPAASLHVTGPAITTAPDRAGLLQYIADAIGDAGAPAPNGKTLYLVYLPTGITLTGGLPFESFHSAYPAVDAGLGDGFAVVARQTPGPGETQLDNLTKIASHEIVEAATDPGLDSWCLTTAAAKPWTGSVWSAIQAGHIENGDLCEGTRVREPAAASGALYQRSWSVRSAAAGDAAAGDPCVPARATPYVNVSAPKEWYAGVAGTSVKIPFTGWSTAATNAWLMNSVVMHSTTVFDATKLGAGLTLATPLGNGAGAGCASRQAMNNGVAGTLTVDIPATAVSGDYAVIGLHSFREVGKCGQDAAEDIAHFWPVGVYVP